jgi:hypothetical protein
MAAPREFNSPASAAGDQPRGSEFYVPLNKDAPQLQAWVRRREPGDPPVSGSPG